MADDGANKAFSGRNQRGINFKDRARKVAPLMQVLARECVSGLLC